jgi:hypothetical protein
MEQEKDGRVRYIDGEKGKWKPNTAVLKAVTIYPC